MPNFFNQDDDHISSDAAALWEGHKANNQEIWGSPASFALEDRNNIEWHIYRHVEQDVLLTIGNALFWATYLVGVAYLAVRIMHAI